MTIDSTTGLDNKITENPLTIENGIYYWISGETFYGRVASDFGRKNLPEIRGVVLDLGCSTGETTREISNLYPQSKVIGLDRNPERICQAKRKVPECDFLIADIYNLPFAKESFNAIFCMNNLWYLISKNRTRVPRQVILSLAELVSDGGYLFFSGGGNSVMFRKEEKVEFWDSSIPEEARPYSPQLSYLIDAFQLQNSELVTSS